MTLKLYGSGSIENVDSIVTSASATLSSTELGFLDGINGIGKVLQIVRATNSTTTTTTSGTFVDAPGMSVTITPTKSTSAIIVLAWGYADLFSTSDGDNRGLFVITDSSNNAVSGGGGRIGISGFTGSGTRQAGGLVSLLGYATPATTSATTYKLRYSTSGVGTIRLQGASHVSQMYAIEVGA